MSINFTASTDAIESSRADLLDAIACRATYEREHNGGDKTAIQLAAYYKRAIRLDAFTLAYAASVGKSWKNSIMSAAKQIDVNAPNPNPSGDLCNIYSISKEWEIMRVLNGSSFNLPSSDGATCAATVAALASGKTGKDMIYFVNEFVTRIRSNGKAYVSGGTQSCSSLRALESLGIVNNMRQIVRPDLFALLMPRDGTQEADSAPYDGVTIDGETDSADCLLALPAPLKSAALADAEIDAVSAMLALPAPPAPAKAGKAKAKKAKHDASVGVIQTFDAIA